MSQQPGLTRRAIAPMMVIMLASILPSAGWCPPPPSVLEPFNPRFEFGTVAIGRRTVVTIEFSAGPLMTAEFRAVVATPLLAFARPADESSLTVDVAGTTCIPGTVIDRNVRCTLAMAFQPNVIGPFRSGIFVLQVLSTDPVFPQPRPIAYLTASGEVVAAPLPGIEGLWAGVLIAVLLLATAAVVRKSR